MNEMLAKENKKIKEKLNKSRNLEAIAKQNVEFAIMESNERVDFIQQEYEDKLRKLEKDKEKLKTAYKCAKDEVQRLQLWCSVNPEKHSEDHSKMGLEIENKALREKIRVLERNYS